MKRNHKSIFILSFFKEFLNTSKETFYKNAKIIVRETLSLDDNITVYSNGYYYKPIIYINESLALENITIPIKRLLVIYGNNKRDTIYMYPSFVVKYCPFPLNDIQWVFDQCISKGVEPFDKLKDPDKILESSIPYENWIQRLNKTLENNHFQEKFAKYFYDTFYTLINIKTSKAFFENCLSMIKEFVEKLNLNIVEQNIINSNLLSYANYQLPFR